MATNDKGIAVQSRRSRVTLETPAEFEAWWAEGQARDAETRRAAA